jgi:4-amino-4-deoxy-L-arabinose transferase-like glycosyltransferase
MMQNLSAADSTLAVDRREPRPGTPLTVARLAAAWPLWLFLAWAALVIALYYRAAWPLLMAGGLRQALSSTGLSSVRNGLPFARDAAVTAATGVAGLIIVSAAIMAAGRLLIRFWAPHVLTPTERIALTAAFGAWTLAYAFLTLAFLGIYTPTVVRVVVAVLAAFEVWQAISARASWRDAVERGRAYLRDANAGTRLWMAMTCATCAYAFVCALAPETEFDAVWYHLDLPRRWLEAGHPIDDITEYVSLYPLTWELLFGAGLSVDGVASAKLLHWAALPLCSTIVLLLANRTRVNGWLAAAIFCTAPTVFWEATTAYVDLALAFHVGVAVYAAVRWLDTDDRRWLLVSALQLGVAIATKHLGLVAVASLVPVLYVVRQQRAGVMRALRAVVVVCLVSLAVAVPWYARSALASGNPVFPELSNVFGARPPERWGDNGKGLDRFKTHFGRPRTALNQLTLPWDMAMHAPRYGGTFGPLLLLLAPGAVFATSRRRLVAALLAGAAIYFAVWASPAASFQLRFLLPAWLIVAVALAAGADAASAQARSVDRRLAAALTGALALLLALNLPPFIPLHEGDRRGWSNWLTHVVHDVPTDVVLGAVSHDRFLATRVRSYEAWQWINQHLPADARVLTMSGGDQLYARRARVPYDANLVRTAVWAAPTVADAARELRRLSITYVLVPKPILWTPDLDSSVLLPLANRRQVLDLVHEDFWYEVYRVRVEKMKNVKGKM